MMTSRCWNADDSSAEGLPCGPAYDALIAFIAVGHEATLLSLDQRAISTYEAIGATVEQLAL
jgi:hypothetical protein